MEQVLQHLGIQGLFRGKAQQRRGPCPIHAEATETVPIKKYTCSVHLGKNSFTVFKPTALLRATSWTSGPQSTVCRYTKPPSIWRLPSNDPRIEKRHPYPRHSVGSQKRVLKVPLSRQTRVDFHRYIYPGRLFKAKVEYVITATGEGQYTPSGQLPSAAKLGSLGALAVKIRLDEMPPNLPLGAGGAVAIYTSTGQPVHIVSKVAIRMKKWLLYVVPS